MTLRGAAQLNEYYVGQDEYYAIGGQWLDIVGATADERARLHAALLQAAKQEVVERYPAAGETRAYSRFLVWILWSDAPNGYPAVYFFSSENEAMSWFRSAQQEAAVPGGRRIVAFGIFDRMSRLWPTPKEWVVAQEPQYDGLIARAVAWVTSAPISGAWPWVGGPQPVYGPAPAYDPTKDPNWAGARSLVLSTIQAVIGDDATFNRIAAQVIAHLRRQGFINDRANALINRPDFLSKLRAYLRKMIYYIDTSTLIDLTARDLFRVLKSGAVAKPF